MFPQITTQFLLDTFPSICLSSSNLFIVTLIHNCEIPKIIFFFTLIGRKHLRYGRRLVLIGVEKSIKQYEIIITQKKNNNNYKEQNYKKIYTYNCAKIS